ncbi:MAG: Do family serine endopeptidase [Saprospiraceae bacterium]|nr:Do family serine endopeptidase [Saprospiraceae bacterium]MCB0542742.1 Do family serine endopeptidase [Saprospiraceae bacterium]MCB9356574.1 Do family serine endopeptidase [Lewinellaceae bacterium]
MKKYLLLLLVSLTSSLLSVFLYSRLVDTRRVVWENDDGEVRYTSLVDKLFNARSTSAFQSSAPTNFIEAAEIATPSVVNIRALQESGSGIWGSSTLTGSSGSGVILSPDGYIVTNHHVVERSTDIKVTLADKREYKAKLIGSDPSTDITLLKIDEGNLPFIVFGNSDSVRIGEWVLAVGNPFNLESTVTAGIISAKGRNINILGGGASIESFIQTDAAVNPGNSGGALVNTVGELIGINTAIITESGSYEGYSFAVPSNLVQKVIRDLREFGQVQRAYLGVSIQELDSETAREIGLPNAEGVYINRVTTNGAAQDAGLKIGDVILGLNTAHVKSPSELQEYIGRFRPGDQVSLDYWRSGKKYRIRITLKDINNSIAATRVRGDELEDDLGIELRDLSGDEQRKMRIQGVMVTSVRRGSVIYNTNMQPGFVISSVNGNRVSSAAEAIEAIKNAYNSLVLDGYYEGEPDLYSYRFKKDE